MSGFVGLAVVLLVVCCLCSRGKRASYPISGRGPGNGHGAAHATRHEDGHRRVANGLGCKTRFERDEHGIPVTTVIVSGPPLTPAEHTAIALGGRMAAGGRGCSGDEKLIRKHLSVLPASERAAARREGERIARRFV